MQGSNDIVGGRITVNLESGKRRSVALTADEAYDLMKYAKSLKKKQQKPKSLKQFDRMVYFFYKDNMSVPSIALKLNTTQLCVEGAIKRIESGRYGDSLNG